MVNLNNKVFKIKNPTTGLIEEYKLKPGKSLYDIAVEQKGFEGTKEEFFRQLFGLDALKARVAALKAKK